MPKHVHLVTALNETKQWSWALMLILVVLNAKLSFLKLLNTSACVLNCNLVWPWTEQIWSDWAFSSFILHIFSFFTINTSSLSSPVFRLFFFFPYVFVEISCLIFPFSVLQLQTTWWLYYKKTKGSINKSRIQSKRISSTIPFPVQLSLIN